MRGAVAATRHYGSMFDDIETNYILLVILTLIMTFFNKLKLDFLKLVLNECYAIPIDLS